MKKGKTKDLEGKDVEFDVPDGIIAHLTKECGGNVHDLRVNVTCGSFEKETNGTNSYSGAYSDFHWSAAKDAVDLATHSCFQSAYRCGLEVIPHTRNNWVCCSFTERLIIPTHYTIRMHEPNSDAPHLKSSLIETPLDGESWRKVAHEDCNKPPNGRVFTAVNLVGSRGKCHLIRLVSIDRTHNGDYFLAISAWEFFGRLAESRADLPISLSFSARAGRRRSLSTGRSLVTYRRQRLG
jgi:hypothetical protein